MIELTGPYRRHYAPWGKVTSTALEFFVSNGRQAMRILQSTPAQYSVVSACRIHWFKSLQDAQEFCKTTLSGVNDR